MSNSSSNEQKKISSVIVNSLDAHVLFFRHMKPDFRIITNFLKHFIGDVTLKITTLTLNQLLGMK